MQQRPTIATYKDRDQEESPKENGKTSEAKIKKWTNTNKNKTKHKSIRKPKIKRRLPKTVKVK